MKMSTKHIAPAEIVLGVGSADGMFSKVILDATRAKHLTGLDIVKTSVAWAKKHWKNWGTILNMQKLNGLQKITSNWTMLQPKKQWSFCMPSKHWTMFKTSTQI